MRLSLGAIIIIFASLVWGKQWLSDPEVQRFPASIASQKSVVVESIENEDRLPVHVQHESFRFSRLIDARLIQKIKDKEQSRPFAKIEYEGAFTLQWLSPPSSKHRKAFVSYEINFSDQRRLKSTVPMIVEFESEQKINQVEMPFRLTEAESDQVSILKDFISIYAIYSEEDTHGRFEATYQTEGNQLKMSKVRYLENQNRPPISIVLSDHQMTLDSSGAMIDMKGVENTKLSSVFDSELYTHSEYKLERLQQRIAKRSPISGEILVPSSLQIQMNAWLEAPPWSKVQRSLDRIATLSRSARMSLFHDTVKSLKKSDEHLNDFRHWAEVQSTQSSSLRFGIGVLATLGNAQAQKILLEWMNQYPETKHDVLNALATAETPLVAESHAQVFSFLELAKEGSRDSALTLNAALTLGADLRKTGSNPEVEAKLVSLYEAADVPEKLVYLDAMGNSGLPAFAPTLDKALSSQEVVIREKSVFASRFMPPELTDVFIQRSLQDVSSQVQLSAVKTIVFQGSVEKYRSHLKKFADGKDELARLSRQALSSE